MGQREAVRRGAERGPPGPPHGEAIALDVPGIGFRSAGSLIVALAEEELKVMEDFALGPDAAERNIELLEPPAIRRLNPALSDSVLGALWAPEDGVIEPERVLTALRTHLEKGGRYRFVGDRFVPEAESGVVVDHLRSSTSSPCCARC